MTQAMGRSVARLVVVLVVAGSLTLVGHPARACSCAGAPVSELLPSADGAFVGTFVRREGLGDVFWWVLLGMLVAAAGVVALRRWGWAPDTARSERGVA